MDNQKQFRVNHRSDRAEIIELYQKLFRENDHIYILGGELNPLFYENIVDKCYDFAKDKVVNFICGPFISVRDELFKKYHDIHNNHLGNWWYAKRKGEWWKIHPVFEKAYENDNINIFILKQRQDNHFCLGAESRDIIVEDNHDELREAKATVYLKNAVKARQYLDKWEEIKETKCFKWEKGKEERLFKPIYKIKREQKLEEKIAAQFQAL